MTKEQTFEHPPRGHVALLYYDVANDRFQVVQGDDVDTAIPATAKALLTSTLAHGYDGSAWRKQAPIWGYSDRLAEQKLHTMTAGTTYVMAMTAVPPGYVDRIVGFSLATDKAGAGCLPYADFAGALMVIYPSQTMAANVYKAVSPYDLILKAGDYVQFNWSGVAVNDVLIANIWGYRMAVAM